MQIKAIHQFHPTCTAGDGVTNGMLFARRLLRELGFESEIYCEHVPPELAGEIKPLQGFKPRQGDLLFVHHSLGYENSAWMERLAIPKVLVYHNITPAHLLPEGILRRLSVLGRQQLPQWAPGFLGGIGDSDTNSDELREADYRNIATIPMLVDLDGFRAAALSKGAMQPQGQGLNLLFVGRICENKCQLELVDVVRELQHFADQPVRLTLAGGISSGEYLQRIQSRISELGLENCISLPGKVSDSELASLYRNADIFVCMSEHEGFGMPLIEAMLFDVPVVARAITSVPGTMGEGGLLIEDPNPRSMAALLHLLSTEPGLRRRVIAGQRRNLRRFEHANLLTQLAGYLEQLGIQVPRPPVPQPAPCSEGFWQVEGPFDSNYSLAIVNRHLARALEKRGRFVGLRSMEGRGDFQPSTAFLAANPDVAAMARRPADVATGPDVTLRFCYPPHVNDMRGQVRAVHSYGWEETGFPAEYVAAFNSRLDVVTVLSEFVEKILRDNGVRLPMAVTGGGVDHLLDVVPKLPAARMRGYRFLHISSCFPRKGVDALLAAYGKAFRDHDDVSLVIKTFPNPHNDVAQQIKALKESDPQYPDVVLLNYDCSDAELVGLYQSCHAFVAPSRGEGLGLPMAEAMLFNLPVITTAWGGQRDFCDDSTAWLCDYRFAKTRTHLGTAHSVWAEPDADHLAQLLREVHDLTPEQRAVRTVAARRRIVQDYTWDRVAERVAYAVQAVAAQPVLRNESRIGWISTCNTRCGIATYSSFLSVGIPQDRLTILANRTAERTAPDGEHVVRCWNMHYEETLDDTYDVIMERGIKAVVIQYNFGFFTLQAFARLIERLKQAGVAVHCFFHATGDLVRDGKKISLADIASSLKLADRIYVHGLQDLNRLKGYGLVDNVVFFPHGVLPALPADEEKRKAQLQGKRLIAAYGFLLPHKGIQPLIRAFARMAKKDASLHLLLLNALYPAPESAQEHQTCEKLVAELGLGQRVSFVTDFLPDAECLARLQMADLIVYPYQQTGESASGAVRIGLAAGRPVAVTPLPIFEDVADAVHSLPGTDPESIARGIERLLNDSEVIAEQAEKTRQWIASREWSLLSVRLLNVIDGLANPLS